MNSNTQTKTQAPNMERISNAAYGIVSILKLLGPLNRHVLGEVPIDDAVILEVASGYVIGGLETAIRELAITILDLSAE